MKNIWRQLLVLGLVLASLSQPINAIESRAITLTLPENDNGSIQAIAFSADGRLFAASSYAFIYVWNARTGALIRSIKGFGGARDLNFSPDGRFLAAANIEGTWKRAEFSGGFLAGEVSIGSSESWEMLHKLPVVRGNALSVRFSPDSKTLAAGCGDNKVRL